MAATLGATPLQPEGYDSGAMRKCARWGWLNWGVGVSYPPVGSKKGGRLCFLGGRVPVEPLVQALPYHTDSTAHSVRGHRWPVCPEANLPQGQGVDDSWAHGLMRQLGQHLGQGSCCPARWFLQGREAFRSCDMAVVLCLGQQRQSASRTLQCCLTEGPPLPHWGCSPHHWPGVRRSVLP